MATTDAEGELGTAGAAGEADDRFRARVLDSLPQLALVLDEQGTITFASGKPPRGVQLDVEGLVGRHAADVVHGDDLEAVLGVLPDRGVHVGDVVGPMAFRYHDDTGAVRVVEGLAWDRLDDPEIRGLVVTLRDIVGPHMVEQAFADLAAGADLATICPSILRAVAEPPLDGAGVVVLAGGAPGAVPLAVSPSLGRAPHLAGQVALHAPLYEPRHGADRFDPELARFPVEARDALERLGVGSATVVPVVVRGHTRPPLHLVACFPWTLPPSLNQTNLLDRHARVLGLAYERLDLEAQLVHAAEHDPLSGLPNRAAFLGWIDAARRLQGRRHDDASCALLYLDLDGFKAVNDRLGHPAGDAVLAVIGQRLAAAVREVDRVARLGGDEFAVVLRGATERDAVDLAERLVETVGEAVELDAGPARVGVSIGVAVGPPWELDALLERADAAMYRAKRGAVGAVHVAEDQALA